MKTTIVITLFILSFSSFASNCIQNRAAFDIGSGTTKMKVAEVDICKKKIKKILLEKNVPVAYKEDLKRSTDKNFTKAVMLKGFSALSELKAAAAKFSPKKYFGVATSAFRKAKNGETFAKEIQTKLGIEVRVISQVEEAKVGYLAAVSSGATDGNNVLVWDIGGGSMQMITEINPNDFEIYEGKLASVSFKNFVVEDILKKDVKKVMSPNPLGNVTANKAIEAAVKHAKEKVSKELKEFISKNKPAIVGIGGVHYYSLGKQAGSREFTVSMLEAALEKRSKLDDKAIGGKYAATDVTNIALVIGYMKALGIEKVSAKKLNLADGALVVDKL